MEIEYGFIRGENGLYQTAQFLEICKAVKEARPDLLVIIDAFPCKESPVTQKRVLSHLSEMLSHQNTHFLFLEKTHHTIGGCGVQITDDNYKKAIEYSEIRDQKFFVVMPFTIRHFLFGAAYFENVEHEAFDHLGRLKPDASWMLKCHNNRFNNFLADCIGFAQPFPDCEGDGAHKVQDYFHSMNPRSSAAKPPPMDWQPIERVRNAIRLAKDRDRVEVITQRDEDLEIATVDAYGFGWFHTGTLITKIKEKYPKVEVVVIKNNTLNPIARKGRLPQVSVAYLNVNRHSSRNMIKRMANITKGSPQYFHVPVEVFEKLKSMFDAR